MGEASLRRVADLSVDKMVARTFELYARSVRP
jgi:hypothetical protein